MLLLAEGTVNFHMILCCRLDRVCCWSFFIDLRRFCFFHVFVDDLLLIFILRLLVLHNNGSGSVYFVLLWRFLFAYSS